MDYDQLFPGRFLKSGEFKGKDVTLTIAGITIEELPQEGGSLRVRGIIQFRETKKALVLNRTNGECMKGMFGRDTDKWIGKRLTLFPAAIEAFGGQEIAIRVRGSPDIAKTIRVEIKLPRRRPINVTMMKTDPKKQPTPEPPKSPAEVEAELGEPAGLDEEQPF